MMIGTILLIISPLLLAAYAAPAGMVTGCELVVGDGGALTARRIKYDPDHRAGCGD